MYTNRYLSLLYILYIDAVPSRKIEGCDGGRSRLQEHRAAGRGSRVHRRITSTHKYSLTYMQACIHTCMYVLFRIPYILYHINSTLFLFHISHLIRIWSCASPFLSQTIAALSILSHLACDPLISSSTSTCLFFSYFHYFFFFYPRHSLHLAPPRCAYILFQSVLRRYVMSIGIYIYISWRIAVHRESPHALIREILDSRRERKQQKARAHNSPHPLTSLSYIYTHICNLFYSDALLQEIYRQDSPSSRALLHFSVFLFFS